MIHRRPGFEYVGPGWRWPGVFAAITYLNTKRRREIDRDARLVWVLIALIALAPEIIAIGRLLLK